MDSQTKKLNAIQYAINLQNELKLKSLTRKHLVDRAKRSNEEYLAGKFKSQEQLELESENW